MRRVTKLVAVSAAALMLAGCGSDDEGDSAGAGGGDKKTLKVGLAYDIGGRGDQSFNDMAAAGLDRVKKDLNIQTKELSAKPDETDADKEQRLTLLASEGFNPIIGVGFAYTTSTIKVAKQFPDVKFLVVDADGCKVEGANVLGACFAEEQGSFLVGAAAALKSKTGTVGFVGGVNVPLIQKFFAGYQAGAKAAKADIKILPPKYLTQPPNFNGFRDSALGREGAKGQYDAGADVVYHAAGGAGLGVFESAKAAQKWAIGVDADQYNQPPVAPYKDSVLTSMVKHVDLAVFDFVEAVSKDEFKAGTKKYDLSNDGVAYSPSGGKVDDVKDKLDAFKKDIVDGKIQVPTTPTS